MFKKYKIGFDLWGVLLFLIIMIPNFIWFAVSAPNDILRADSITKIIAVIISCLLYFVSWLLYYCGITNAVSVLQMFYGHPTYRLVFGQ